MLGHGLRRMLPRCSSLPRPRPQRYAPPIFSRGKGGVNAGSMAALPAKAELIDGLPTQLPGLASFLFAVALVRAEPFLLTAALPVAPAVLASVHSIGLGDGK